MDREKLANSTALHRAWWAFCWRLVFLLPTSLHRNWMLHGAGMAYLSEAFRRPGPEGER